MVYIQCQLLQTIPKKKHIQSVSRNKIESELNRMLLARDTGIAADEVIKRIAILRKDIRQENTWSAWDDKKIT